MPRRYVAFVAIACVAATAPSAKAQLPNPPAPWGSLEAGRSVRILTRDGMRHDGWVRRIGEDTMFLQLPYDPGEAISLPAIDSLWVRRGHAPQGALIGALVFGVPAAAIGPAVACGDPGCDFSAADRVILFFLGALPGAALGALIGSVIPAWTVFFPPPATSHG